jgi:hypothetical protein
MHFLVFNDLVLLHVAQFKEKKCQYANHHRFETIIYQHIGTLKVLSKKTAH